MKKTDNLRYFTADQDRDLARENGKAGGVKSGESRRWRKALREFLQNYLGQQAPPELQEWMDFYDIASGMLGFFVFCAIYLLGYIIYKSIEPKIKEYLKQD